MSSIMFAVYNALTNQMFDELDPQTDDHYDACAEGVCAIARETAEVVASTINNLPDALEVARLLLED